MLEPTSSAASSTSATGATIANTKKNDLGQKDIFLKLLVAQMENQDPLKPQDATQMSSQLAQFNMVEQQTTSNKWLEQLATSGGINPSSNALSNNAASYLGHSVTVNQNKIYYDGTNQSFSAVLDKPATDTQVFIFDNTGKPVRTITLNNLSSGANPMVWDGLLDSGATAPQGNYSIQLSALNSNGAEVAYDIQRTGQVEAVRFNATGTELVVGGVATSMANISEIRL